MWISSGPIPSWTRQILSLKSLQIFVYFLPPWCQTMGSGNRLKRRGRAWQYEEKFASTNLAVHTTRKSVKTRVVIYLKTVMMINSDEQDAHLSLVCGECLSSNLLNRTNHWKTSSWKFLPNVGLESVLMNPMWLNNFHNKHDCPPQAHYHVIIWDANLPGE